VQIFEGQLAVVTGATGTIGKAIALELARNGANLFLIARTPQKVADTVSEIATSTGVKVYGAASDLGTLEGCEEAYTQLANCYRDWNILINCAGATRGGLWPEQADDDWLDGFALKFFGAVRMTRLLWPGLKRTHGTVINISGGMARAPKADFMIGGAVNAALANFTKALAEQGLRDDVNVNWISPGTIASKRREDILAHRAAQRGIDIEILRAEELAATGLRRMGEGRDVAHLVSFLCRPESRHIHGTGITVDGGENRGFY